jgi:hypothetical protein
MGAIRNRACFLLHVRVGSRVARELGCVTPWRSPILDGRQRLTLMFSSCSTEKSNGR